MGLLMTIRDYERVADIDIHTDVEYENGYWYDQGYG